MLYWPIEDSSIESLSENCTRFPQTRELPSRFWATIILNKTDASVMKDDKVILSGTRGGPNQLWNMDLSSISTKSTLPEIVSTMSSTLPTPTCTYHAAVSQPVEIKSPLVDQNDDFNQIGPEFSFCSANFSHHILPDSINNDIKRKVNYFHAALGSPPIPTLINAIKLDYFSLPGISTKVLQKHLSPQPATDMGHMKRIRQGLNSTKINNEVYYDFEEPFDSPNSNNEVLRNHQILYKLTPSSHRTHVDATGAFHFSNGSSCYDLVFFHEDSNYIHVEPFEFRSDKDYKDAFQLGINFFHNKKMSLDIFRMDSEHKSLNSIMCKDIDATIELVPPYSHRALQAERAIQTWKNHKLSMLATVDPTCPDTIFKLINQQCEMTLNLLRRSGVSEHMSAYQQLHGRWDYSKNPIAPVGTKVQIFKSRKQRETTWSFHSLNGWYVGPAMNFKNCFEIYVSSTRDVRISDTVTWYPTAQFSMPGFSPRDQVLLAFNNLTEAVINMAPISQQPIDRATTDFVSSLNQFKTLFDTADNKTTKVVVDDNPPPGFEPLSLPISVTTPTVIADTVPIRASKRLTNHRPNYAKINAGLSAYFANPANIKKIVYHRGGGKNSNQPLQFLVRFKNSVSKEDKWYDSVDIIDTDILQTYISKKPYLSQLMPDIILPVAYFNVGDTVIYTSHSDEVNEAIIVKVHLEDLQEINYTIQLLFNSTIKNILNQVL